MFGDLYSLVGVMLGLTYLFGLMALAACGSCGDAEPIVELALQLRAGVRL